MRPVGHITTLIRDLERWAASREAKSLPAQNLRTAAAYLAEYRALITSEALNDRR